MNASEPRWWAAWKTTLAGALWLAAVAALIGGAVRSGCS